MENTSLFDFEPWKIQERKRKQEEDQKIMDYLATLSPFEIMQHLRESGGHPRPLWGESKTWRFHYMRECDRRGMNLLKELGWPTDKEALYVNIHIGSVEPLGEIDKYTHEETKIWSVIEHWEPYDSKKPNTRIVSIT